MKELQTYRSSVDPYWPRADRFFDELPSDSYRQGRLLRETLAVRHSPTGDFHDVLRRTDDHPLVQCHLWLLDDLRIPPDKSRRSTEGHLFAAMVFTLGVESIQRNMTAADSFFDPSFAELAETLRAQIRLEYAAVVDPDAAFWEIHEDLWNAADDEASTEVRQAPFILSTLAALEAAGRTELRPALVEMLRHLNAVLAMRHDLLAMRRDLGHGTITAPVRKMIEDGPPLDDAAEPETLLGSLLLSGAVDALVPIWSSYLEAFDRHASELHLPTFARYGRHLGALMEAVHGVLRIPSDAGPPGVPAPQFEPSDAPVPEAIAMAERYLMADPTFRDAWEVHRWGMAGAPEVTARFPAGLVIEALGKHGHDVADLVDGFYHDAVGRGFAYYDHPNLHYVETDTLGAMLRLYPYTKQTGWHREVLDQYLALLAPHIASNGRLPVWLVADQRHPLLGEHCGAIEANLLRGMLAYDPEGLGPLVDASARRLLAEFAKRGAAITVNYPRPYLLAVLGSLLIELERHELGGTIDEAWDQLEEGVVIEERRDRATPMTAASLMLARAASPTDQMPDEHWQLAVLKGQSFDGGWGAEPIFFAPNRGRSVTWHASRLLTSAVCYDALASSVRVS